MKHKNKEHKSKSARSKAMKRFFEACLETLAASAQIPHF